jgi:hypothetical protein
MCSSEEHFLILLKNLLLKGINIIDFTYFFYLIEIVQVIYDQANIMI